MSMSSFETAGRSRMVRTLVAIVAASFVSPAVMASQTDISGPSGSMKFGTTVTALPNGNFVVTDPQATIAGQVKAGAVYLYSPAGTLISTLTGTMTYDSVGSGGIIVVGDGNFVVLSPSWSSPSATDAGAATWISGTSGMNGPVSASNSLIGSANNDNVGLKAFALTNGNYVVLSPYWNGVGAATWANGNTPTAALVSITNSLHGTTNGDSVGFDGAALSNGNYTINSPMWSNGSVDARYGAVTWVDGTEATGTAVSITNSLYGTTVGDRVGVSGTVALSNGHYVVSSRYWNNGVPDARVGAATWGNGLVGTAGAVTTSNSLHGAAPGEEVGTVIALQDGNYVACTPYWSNSMGAATWGSGTVGVVGVASTGNSLTGTVSGDRVCNKVDALIGGNYAVSSPSWNGGQGAATWCAAGGICTGQVTAANSFTGTKSGWAFALADGNYAVASPGWNNGGATAAGAATWASGSLGLFGQVAPGQSLIGVSANDRIGSNGIVGTAAGSYVVASNNWHDAGGAQVGAITWVRGGQALPGLVTARNSLVGGSSGDGVGLAFGLSDGNYVVYIPSWDNGALADAGAMTLASGHYRLVGKVAAWNSVRGGVANGGGSMVYSYDPTRQQLVVGRPAENIVSLFTMDQIFADNFEP